MNSRSLSPICLKVYEFIVDFKRDHDGNSPSMREICDGCKIPSTSTVTYYLRNLEKSGMIEILQACPRMISVRGGAWTPPQAPTGYGKRRNLMERTTDGTNNF